MSKYEEAVKEYEEFKLEMRKMYEKEREILDRLQEHCPHKNTYVMDSHPMCFEDIEENETKSKCRDCGKILYG